MIAKTVTAVAAALILGASPAFANEADMSLAVDEEFSELFSSWEDLDDGGRITAAGEIEAAPRLAVSVPSGMPLEDIRLTSAYGERNHPILRQRRRHHGVDLAAPTGTPVYATADGRVSQAEWFSSYGKYVRIEHGGEMHTRFAHLSSYTVAEGDQVKKGDLIGYVGSTGRSTGPHLHYEVRVANESVNPIPYMTPQYASIDEVDGARGGSE